MATSNRSLPMLLAGFTGGVCLQCLGFFVAADFLRAHNQSVPAFTFLVLGLAAAMFAAVFKPWINTKRLPKKQTATIVICGALWSLSAQCFLFGLKYCGPLKSVLLQYADLAICYALLVFFGWRAVPGGRLPRMPGLAVSSSSNPASLPFGSGGGSDKGRRGGRINKGAVIMTLAFLVLVISGHRHTTSLDSHGLVQVDDTVNSGGENAPIRRLLAAVANGPAKQDAPHGHLILDANAPKIKKALAAAQKAAEKHGGANANPNVKKPQAPPVGPQNKQPKQQKPVEVKPAQNEQVADDIAAVQSDDAQEVSGEETAPASQHEFLFLGVFRLSHNFAGIALLALGSVLSFVTGIYQRKLVKDLNTAGPKRAFGASLLAATAVSGVCGFGHFVVSSSDVSFFPAPRFQTLLTVAFVAVAWPITQFSLDTLAIGGRRTGPLTSAKVSSLRTRLTFLTSFLCIAVVAMMRQDRPHQITLTMALAAVAIFVGLDMLMRDSSLQQGKSGGFGSLPQFSGSSALVGKSRNKQAFIISKSALRRVWRHIMESRDSRRIFTFLVINTIFMFVEFLYGFLTNSLGLISDACHMLFDCVALAIGLYASYISKVPANDRFTFGYGRAKTVSGFINAVFLIFIAFSVFVESIQRLMSPPEIRTESLLVVSVLGFLVNMIGIVFFHDAHMAGHGDGGCSHGHSHGGGDHNMEGIFLHVLADTLGSVGVIVSSIFVHYFGWVWTDAVCSIMISSFILVTVYPLLKQSTNILLQHTPDNVNHAVNNAIHHVLRIDGVLGYRLPHFWVFGPGQLVGTIHIKVAREADQQHILQQATALFQDYAHVKFLSMQMEKEEFLQTLELSSSLDFRHESPLGADYQHGPNQHKHDLIMGHGNSNGHSHQPQNNHGHSHGNGVPCSGHHGDSHGQSHGGHSHGHSQPSSPQGSHSDHHHSHSHHDHTPSKVNSVTVGPGLTSRTASSLVSSDAIQLP